MCLSRELLSSTDYHRHWPLTYSEPFPVSPFPSLLFPGVLCSCACVMLLPSVSEANAAGKDAKITKTINSCALFGLCFGLIFTCIFYLLSDFIGDFLFSSKLCGYFLRRLCFLCPLMHISGMLCSILHGLGKAKQVLLSSICSPVR